MKQWTPAQIKRFRLSRRQSQPAFAASVGVYWLTVSKWERRIQEPSLEHKKALDDLEIVTKATA